VLTRRRLRDRDQGQRLRRNDKVGLVDSKEFGDKILCNNRWVRTHNRKDGNNCGN
jgi:hypothetical protein